MGNTVERPIRPHPLHHSTLRPPLSSSSTSTSTRSILINMLVEVNLPDHSGEGLAWLEGLIGPLEREELSA